MLFELNIGTLPGIMAEICYNLLCSLCGRSGRK